MATILIEHIVVQSMGGNPIRIRGIDPTTHDCILGEVTFPGGEAAQKAAWNLSGLMRGGGEPTNLNMKIGELRELAILVRQLGYKD